jgi:hypothetical protein
VEEEDGGEGRLRVDGGRQGDPQRVEARGTVDRSLAMAVVVRIVGWTAARRLAGTPCSRCWHWRRRRRMERIKYGGDEEVGVNTARAMLHCPSGNSDVRLFALLDLENLG